MPPPITHVLETSLYAKDLVATVAFYKRVLGLSPMLETPRLVAFDAGRGSVLLIFQGGSTSSDIVTASGTVPGHDAAGRLHFALGIPTDSLAKWRAHLKANDVSIIGEMCWERGGVSLYFHDPDGHVAELATPGLWANY
jgi:catechol-2,3-dioxygenase